MDRLEVHDSEALKMAICDGPIVYPARQCQGIRKEIISDLQTAGYDIGAMERFGAQPQVPYDVCLREVRKAGVVVLLIGPR